ncbi:hypothetical protein FACS1894161_5400 [Spirochaetia bacterium]|nr:hypothetical protein FACS1894161_5400 [Spirochaetia bacterium]
MSKVVKLKEMAAADIKKKIIGLLLNRNFDNTPPCLLSIAILASFKAGSFLCFISITTTMIIIAIYTGNIDFEPKLFTIFPVQNAVRLYPTDPKALQNP